MFVDTAKVSLEAGKGGDGAVSFRHEIYIPKGGPDGGDGGRGGNVVFRADKDTNTLLDFRYNPILKAENGHSGAGQRAAGRAGKDLVVEVPIGTVVYRVEEAERVMIADLTHDGQTAVVARGGDGGFGNAHFKSSTRQTPRVAEVGEPGEAFVAELELKLLADVGLVGLPNAGKSTFLSVVSNARPEIADYAFTTITPNLGVATVDDTDILIADIPGLIEGAAEGKGLGHAFLRHVDRTAVLLHLVDVYNDDAGAAYQTVRQELAKYHDLARRPEVVALTKTEGLDAEIIEMQRQSILARNPEATVLAISAQAHSGLTEVLRMLSRIISQQREESADGRGDLGAEVGLGVQDGARLGEVHETELGAQDVIRLSERELNKAWQVQKIGDKYVVTGQKIEKFARRTDLANYASVNRLRDIMKKMGIRAELTTQGAKPDSIISIAGKDFTLVEE